MNLPQVRRRRGFGGQAKGWLGQKRLRAHDDYDDDEDDAGGEFEMMLLASLPLQKNTDTDYDDDTDDAGGASFASSPQVACLKAHRKEKQMVIIMMVASLEAHRKKTHTAKMMMTRGA